MNIYKYTCNHCNYYVETSGPWPFGDQGPEKTDQNTEHFPELVFGLTAKVYCPQCDKMKHYKIVEYEKPLASPDSI